MPHQIRRDTASFNHICPSCRAVIYPGEPIFYTGHDGHTLKCRLCIEGPERCVMCGRDISSQARHYLNRHKNYCWRHARGDLILAAIIREVTASEDAECYAGDCQIDAGDVAFYEPPVAPETKGVLYCEDHGRPIADGTHYVEVEE